MTGFLLAVGGLGLAGLDVTGALVVIAALAAGARRRAIAVFAAATLLVTAGFGVALSELVGPRLAGIDWSVLDLPDPMRIVLDLVLAGALLVWALRRHRRRDAPKDPPNPRPGSSAGLAAMGALLGLSAIIDPTFVAVVVLAGRGKPLWLVVVAHVLWILLSQSPLFVLTGAACAGSHGRPVAWFQRKRDQMRPVLDAIATVLLAVMGAALLADALLYFARDEFLIA